MLGVEYLSDLQRMFFTIESMDQKTKNMIPVDSDILIRKVSTQKSFNKSLDKISSSGPSKGNYSNRRDRIASYQKKVRSNDVGLSMILSVIKEMHSLKDKGAVEKQMLKELLETVSKEYAFVFECQLEEAQKVIRKKLIH